MEESELGVIQYLYIFFIPTDSVRVSKRKKKVRPL